MKRKSIPAAVTAISCEDPIPLGSLDRLLRGDIETVFARALEKEPTNRYQSVSALAEDIERCLTNQPILARRPSALYHLKKLLIRHKAPFAFAAVLFLLSIGSAI